LNTSAGYLLVTWFRLSDKNVVADIYVACACYIRLGEGIMVYRQLKRRETAVIEQSESQLSEEQVAALIRQSSTRQVLENVESADIQLTGAQKFAVSQGLNAGKIMIMHEGDGKRGVSGTLRIDQREKLQEIVSGIKEDKIKLVWAYSVSRLFRDRYGVQVATFIELCAQHKVRVVIANAKTFDFSNSFDVTLFQVLANVAARENEDRSNLLHTAKSNKAQRGEYDGRPIKPGFIVDRDKDSPTFDRYIEYAPMAEIVRRLYARFRELEGQFNALWYEVSQMPVVFPPFDASVDSKDIRKFLLIKVCSVHGPSSQRRYKDAQGKWHVEHTGCELKGHECKLAGYHLSKVGLFHLLTAVEYAGYWHAEGEVLMNEDGTPKRNHDRVVPLDTWQFAYSALSFHTIDGEDNRERAGVRSTWVPAKKQDGRYILHGILTSPLGTVNLTGGEYRVAEIRNENTSDRSNTLTINAKLIEYIFRQRLLERIADTNYERMLADALTSLRANNARALISVDEQISRYKNEIASTDAFVLAMGAKIDASTLQDYGKMRSEAVKELADLEKKKHAADVEEKSLQELCYTLGSFRPVWLIR
jgi:DNA invertase Pin-like site-specific DNA recombinase